MSYAALNNKTNSGYALYTQGSLGSSYPTMPLGVDQKQLYLGVRHSF